MKNSVKIACILTVLILGITSTGFGQDEMKINRRKNLVFNGESKKAEIKVTSTSEYNYMVLAIHCNLSQGEITIEFVDPNGKEQGNFTVKTDEPAVIGENTESDQNVSGQMMKRFSKPIKGEWIIRAKPSNAKGYIDLDITQGFEPKIDMIDIKTIK